METKPLVGIFFLTFLSSTILLFSCKQKLKTNVVNIYVSPDNPGFHFIDLSYDTIFKGYQKTDVKFARGQRFQTVIIRSNDQRILPIFLYSNHDTAAKSDVWFVGEYHYDPLQRKFISFYVPTEYQRKRIKDYSKDSSYDDLRFAMDTIVENFLRGRNEIK
jgi:hypothetical protein